MFRVVDQTSEEGRTGEIQKKKLFEVSITNTKWLSSKEFERAKPMRSTVSTVCMLEVVNIGSSLIIAD